MKRKIIFKSMACLIVPFVCFGMMSCGGNKTNASSDSCDSDSLADSVVVDENDAPIEVKQYKYDKSTKYAEVSIDIAAPTGTDDVSAAIRSALLNEVDESFGVNEEDGRCIAKYKGDIANVQKWITYYGAPSLNRLSAMCRDDMSDNSVGDEESGEEGETVQADEEIHSYELGLTITKGKYETSSLAVFDVEYYSDYGGAHPNGVAYCMTFDKKTGKQVKNFFVPGAKSKMQNILRNGLVRYFKANGESVNARTLNECLMLEGNTIPLPACTPVPSSKGLVFTYQQYEIAAYAYGMPSFTVPYSELAPYLTSEAKALFGL